MRATALLLLVFHFQADAAVVPCVSNAVLNNGDTTSCDGTNVDNLECKGTCTINCQNDGCVGTHISCSAGSKCSVQCDSSSCNKITIGCASGSECDMKCTDKACVEAKMLDCVGECSASCWDQSCKDMQVTGKVKTMECSGSSCENINIKCTSCDVTYSSSSAGALRCQASCGVTCPDPCSLATYYSATSPPFPVSPPLASPPPPSPPPSPRPPSPPPPSPP
eukprot:Sspe_Gene.107472::Locus_85620_Transcript_1_1_Confidence_1.000_Length_699::g.107472::m.107472